MGEMSQAWRNLKVVSTVLAVVLLSLSLAPSVVNCRMRHKAVLTHACCRPAQGIGQNRISPRPCCEVQGRQDLLRPFLPSAKTDAPLLSGTLAIDNPKVEIFQRGHLPVLWTDFISAQAPPLYLAKLSFLC